MPTLFVLTSERVPEDVLGYIRRYRSWDLTTTSLGGTSKPLFWATEGWGPRVIPKEWTDGELQQFHTLWPMLGLVSVELEDQEYEDIIAWLKGRSVDKTPQVVPNE